MNNICAFVPARSGSKSILNKNIKELSGKPLIAWTIEAAIKAGIEMIVVSTDGEDIAKIARQYGAEVLVRSPELAQDSTSMFDVLRDEVPKIEPVPELVMLLQPTSPFREQVHIKNAISFLTANYDEYDSLISVNQVPMKYNPSEIIVNTPLGLRMASGAPISSRITRRQSYPDAYRPDGGIYLFKTSNLEKGNLYGRKTMLMEVTETVNINDMDDWMLAESYLKNQS